MIQLNLNELNYRSVEVSDTAAIFDLVIECEQAEYGSHDSSMEDLLHDLESTDPASDSWLVFNSEGVLIGYALLMPWFGNLRYDFFITPSWQDPNLGTELLRHCDQRAKAMLTESPQNDPVNAVCYIANVNERDRKSVIASGFSLSKHIFQMQIEMTESIPEPRWPDGISIRNVNPGKDDKSVHELIETAFSRPDRTPSRFDEWQNAMLRSDIFDPTLWFLATYEDELVGACLGYEYPEQGWVRQLGVIPA